MLPEYVGIIHPGAMGISIGAAAQNGGRQVLWASEGRSPQTLERAAKFGLRDVSSLARLCEMCQLIVCVCPPHAAEEVASQVATYGYKGIYVDGNAIAPQRAVHIGRMMADAGASFVDGGIIGGPAWKPGETWLYLSGPHAELVAAHFAASPLETRVIGADIGKASALKMCYAAYTKGTTALLSAILAAAEQLQVREALEQQWSQENPAFAGQTSQRVRSATAKAWRFVGEMDEIAATFREAGLPGEFHEAAADIYRRMAHLKDAPTLPALEEVLAALLQANAGDRSNREIK